MNVNLAKLLVRARGADALVDPEVARALQLTAEQVQRMRETGRRNAEFAKQSVRIWQQRNREQSISALLKTVQLESHQQLLGVLNAEQRIRFDGMRPAPSVEA